MVYDSTEDTREHIRDVGHFMTETIFNLTRRMRDHDASKLVEPEKSMYDNLIPRLREVPYGSDEYKQIIAEMKPGLQHHYKNNSHHPEHYENGINGMSLLDLLEMFCDWCAASLRSGSEFGKGLEINRERFGMSDQLYDIFLNTIKELW